MHILLKILKVISIILLAIVILIVLLIAGVFIAYKVWIGKAPAIPKVPVVHAHNDISSEGTFYNTQAELITAMGMGWNAGNTEDMPVGKNLYSQPLLKPKLFKKIKELGFDSIRIPVTWRHFVSEYPEFKIDEKRMARVRQVVDQALEAGLIVIINSHHDNPMYTPTQENAENAVAFVGSIWAQVAEEFKDYDNNLIFEAMNEPIIKGTEHEWWYDPGCAECVAKVEVIARCNQAFVDSVRAAGGRNSERYLLMKPYGPTPENALSSIRTLPRDSAEKRIMIAVNSYSPFDLAFQGDFRRSKLTKMDELNLKSVFDKLHESFVKKGIHVVYTEMGMTNKNNPEERYKWAKYYVSETKKRGIACFVWDNGNTRPGVEGFGIISKKSGKVYEESQRYYEGLIDGINFEKDIEE